MKRYQHRQFAGAILASLSAATLGSACLTLIVPPQQRWILALAGGLFLLCAALFGSLSIEIEGEELTWRFGIGVIRRRVMLAAIEKVEVTETRFIEGWGIHLTPRGWLYNVSGYGAVLVTRKDGKTFLLGSDEPDILGEAIRSALAGGHP